MQLEQKKELLPQNGDSISMFHEKQEFQQIPYLNASKQETQSKTDMTMTNSYNIYNVQEKKNVFFVTEKFNLPRERVVEADSCHSSPSHGFKNENSPTSHCQENS